MTAPPSEAPAEPGKQRQLRPGVKKLLVSLVVALVSLGLFSYALGFDFAGDAQAIDDRPEVKRIPLALSMLGFGLSTLLFWSGYLRLARR